MAVKSQEVDPIGSGKFLIFIMKCLGLWYIDSFWYKVYRYLIHSVLTLAFISLMYINIWFIDGIDELVDTSYMALTETGLLAKLFTIFYYGKKVVEFSKNMKDPILSFSQSNEKEYFELRHRTLNRIRKIYFNISIAFCLLSFIDPFIKPDWKLPFETWMPFYWKSWSTYFYAYFYQVFGMLLTCLSNCTMDFFQAYVLMQISLYYKLIELRLERIGWDKEDPQTKLKETIRIRMFVDK